jgi:glyoxylase-like metal-dependent hydrolase (beta-lactamase superfamily II)
MTNPDSPSDLVKPVPGDISSYTTGHGAQIYQLSLQVFPGLVGNVYLVVFREYRVLIDTGSGIGDSNQHLEAGMQAASELAGVNLTPGNLTHILITHGHIDHYGGLSWLRPLTSAKIGIHELDRTVVTDHVERLSMVARTLNEFLIEADVSPERRGPILDMYRATKAVYQSVPVDFTYEEQGMQLGPLTMIHVPGHCPGQVVVRLHDVLFSSDHVLDEISPHQSPERVAPWTGLGHYLQSLESLRPLHKQIRLILAGHGNPVASLEQRINTIRSLHEQRLQKVLDLLSEPLTVSEVSHKLFGEVDGYNVLLALEEAGAHVEYLYQRGLLRVANLSELAHASGSVRVVYQSANTAG